MARKIIPFPVAFIFGLFRLVPDAARRLKIVPFPIPFISGFFRISPINFDLFWMPTASSHFRIFLIFSDFFIICSGCVCRRQNCSPSCFSHFWIFPDLTFFSDLFRMRTAVTKLFPFLFLSFPDFTRLFRIFPTFSDLVRMRPVVAKFTGPLVVKRLKPNNLC